MGLSYVIDAVDESYILIISLPINLTSYNCKTCLYSSLLQDVVDSKCRF